MTQAYYIAIVGSLLLGLTLWGLHQYNARNRVWCLWLVVRCHLVVLLWSLAFGLPARFLAWGRTALYVPGWQVVVSVTLLAAASLGTAILLGWWLGGAARGWARHAIRGMASALVCAPLLAIRVSELPDYVSLYAWFREDPWLVCSDRLQELIPAFALGGLIGLAASLWWERGNRPLGKSGTRNRAIVFALLSVWPANWYVAGFIPWFGGPAWTDHRPLIRYVIWSRPGSLTAWSSDGYSALYYATGFGHINNVRELLAAGANPNAISRRTPEEGLTPLHGAVFWNQPAAAAALLEHGAWVDCGEPTPLDIAISERHPNMVRVLLRYGANVRRRDGRGLTPLHTAALFESHHSNVMVKALLEYGADANAQDREGRTPLHVCVVQKHLGAAQQLLRFHANPLALDLAGQSPLDLARREDLTPFVVLLEEALRAGQ